MSINDPWVNLLLRASTLSSERETELGVAVSQEEEGYVLSSLVVGVDWEFPVNAESVVVALLLGVLPPPLPQDIRSEIDKTYPIRFILESGNLA